MPPPPCARMCFFIAHMYSVDYARARAKFSIRSAPLNLGYYYNKSQHVGLGGEGGLEPPDTHTHYIVFRVR